MPLDEYDGFDGGRQEDAAAAAAAASCAGNEGGLVATENLTALLAIFCLAAAAHAVEFLWKFVGERSIRRERAELKKSLEPIARAQAILKGNNDHFVSYSKLQRKRNKLEGRIEELNSTLGESSSWASLSFLDPAKWISRVKWSALHAVIGIACLVLWWGAPLLQFPERWFWPYAFILSRPGHPAGYVGALGWFIVCSRSLARVRNLLQQCVAS